MGDRVTQDEIDEFLYSVRQFCARCPSIVPQVNQACSLGVQEYIREIAQRANDMEMVASMALAKDLGNSELIRAILERNKGKLSIPFSFYESHLVKDKTDETI